MTMKKQYSYFEQLCAVNYLSLCASNPRMASLARFQDVKRCSDVLRGNH